MTKQEWGGRESEAGRWESAQRPEVDELSYTVCGFGTTRPKGVTVPQKVTPESYRYPDQVSYLPIQSRDVGPGVRKLQFFLPSTHPSSWRLGESPGKVQVMPRQHLGRKSESHPFFCLPFASVPLENPSPSTPKRAVCLRPNPTHALTAPPGPEVRPRCRRGQARASAVCPARSGEGALPGQVSGVSAQGQQEPTAAQRPRGPVRPTATPRRGPPARSA